jgi:hypothetical protein
MLLDERYDYFPKLGARTPKMRVGAAVLLHHHGDGYLRPELRKDADKLRKLDNDAVAKAAAQALDKLLAAWPKKRDRQGLVDGCVAALLRPEEQVPHRELAWRGEQRLLPWCLLQELIYGGSPDAYERVGYNMVYGYERETPLPLKDEARAKLAELCKRVVAEGPEAEKPYAASALVSKSVGWARLTDNDRKGLFLSPQPSVWRWTALSLLRNKGREQLIEWASQRPPEDHLDVLWMLSYQMPKVWPKAELNFWLACARRTPGRVASALNTYEGEVPLALRPPIRAYLEKEIDRPTITHFDHKEGGDLFAAVYRLDRWKDKEDTPLLLKYLRHPFCVEGTRTEGDRRTVSREYRLRGHVKFLLEQRGVEVPRGIVYQETFEEGKK